MSCWEGILPHFKKEGFCKQCFVCEQETCRWCWFMQNKLPDEFCWCDHPYRFVKFYVPMEEVVSQDLDQDEYLEDWEYGAARDRFLFS